MPVVLTLHNFRLFCPNGILLRDGRVCEDCPHHGLHCALQHRCYRGSRAQTLVVVAAYWLHRVLGTWRGIAITTPPILTGKSCWNSIRSIPPSTKIALSSSRTP